MNLEQSGEERIPVSPDKVWAFVTDPQKVGHCLPDVVEVTVLDATHFNAVVTVGVGPVRGKFKMKAELMPNQASRRLDMREIHRRSAAIAWLNPLVATPGYEPTAGAMRAARPFITTFAAVMKLRFTI